MKKECKPFKKKLYCAMRCNKLCVKYMADKKEDADWYAKMANKDLAYNEEKYKTVEVIVTWERN